MIYISAFEHALITQNRNRNIAMRADGDDLVLSDYSDNEVHLERNKNILYAVNRQATMLDYNKELTQTVAKP